MIACVSATDSQPARPARELGSTMNFGSGGAGILLPACRQQIPSPESRPGSWVTLRILGRDMQE